MANKKLKIAFIHPDLGIGGAERLVLDCASALTNEGKHEVYFITNHFDKKHAFKELENGEYSVQVYGDWLPRTIFGKFHALCAYIRMIYLIIYYMLFKRKEDNPDLYFVDLIPIAIPILKLFKQNVIYYCHHPDLLASPPGGSLKKLYRKPIDYLEMNSTGMADVILVNSKYTASVFKKTFPSITKPLQVLYPTVAYSYLESVNKDINIDIETVIPKLPEDSIWFLSLNRFHPAKKLELAILGLLQLKLFMTEEQWKKVYLVVAGGYDPESPINAEYYNKLEELSKENDIIDKIIFLKSPSDDKKVILLKNCHCLIYTPVNEHFGIVPLEAMTVSKPVIACNSGGPQETIVDGVNGFLSEPTPQSMAKCMSKILDSNLAKEMGAKGRNILINKFSYDTFSKNLNQIVISTIKN